MQRQPGLCITHNNPTCSCRCLSSGWVPPLAASAAASTRTRRVSTEEEEGQEQGSHACQAHTGFAGLSRLHTPSQLRQPVRQAHRQADQQAPTRDVVVQVLPRHPQQLQQARGQAQVGGGAGRCGNGGIHRLQLAPNQRTCRGGEQGEQLRRLLGGTPRHVPYEQLACKPSHPRGTDTLQRLAAVTHTAPCPQPERWRNRPGPGPAASA